MCSHCRILLSNTAHAATEGDARNQVLSPAWILWSELDSLLVSACACALCGAQVCGLGVQLTHGLLGGGSGCARHLQAYLRGDSQQCHGRQHRVYPGYVARVQLAPLGRLGRIRSLRVLCVTQFALELQACRLQTHARIPVTNDLTVWFATVLATAGVQQHSGAPGDWHTQHVFCGVPRAWFHRWVSYSVVACDRQAGTHAMSRTGSLRQMQNLV